MTKEELIEKGDEAIRNALENALIIINSKGNALSKKRATDELIFSPKLDCTDEISTVLFDDETDANKTIEDILIPQDDTEKYISIKITKFNPEIDGEPVEMEYSYSSEDGEDLIDNLLIDDAAEKEVEKDSKKDDKKKETKDEES